LTLLHQQIFDVIGPKLMQQLGIASISRLMRADAIVLDAIALSHQFAVTNARVPYCIGHPLPLASK
jgi:hypothetical protein